MSVRGDRKTRLLVQGITGGVGGFHARQCMEYGTNVVAGVTPGKGGQMFDGKVPVFDTVWEARQETGCNVSVIFVPAPGENHGDVAPDRKSTRLNSSHLGISYAVFCLKKKKQE